MTNDSGPNAWRRFNERAIAIHGRDWHGVAAVEAERDRQQHGERQYDRLQVGPGQFRGFVLPQRKNAWRSGRREQLYAYGHAYWPRRANAKHADKLHPGRL